MNEVITQPSEQAIINTLNAELQRSNDNRIYLMALLQEVQQENAQLRARLTEFADMDEKSEPSEPVE